MKVKCSKCGNEFLVRKEVYNLRLKKSGLSKENFDKAYVCRDCRKKHNINTIGKPKVEKTNKTPAKKVTKKVTKKPTVPVQPVTAPASVTAGPAA